MNEFKRVLAVLGLTAVCVSCGACTSSLQPATRPSPTEAGLPGVVADETTGRLPAISNVAVREAASAEAKTIRVNWKKSGTLINQVQMGNPNGSPADPAVLIFGKAVGAPGPADIQVVSRLGSPEWSLDCFDGAGGLKFPMVTNDFAATLVDMSMITATLTEGYVCIDKISGNTHAEFDLVVIGGWGRFKGASGNLSVVVDTIPVGNHMSVESGTIIGSIEK